MTTKKALTIAGSDSGGGAGIQADLKTFQELDVFGMSAITAVTAQNTLGVHGVFPLSIEAVEQQIEAISQDLNPDAIKTGMLFSSDLIVVVANQIRLNQWDKVVVDPVMVAKGGAPLLLESAINALRTELLPHAFVVTPNIPEAELLADMKITSIEDRKEAARKLHSFGVQNVVIKGGHGDEDELIDLLYNGEEFITYKSNRINSKNTHGTGCTFAAAITAELAQGQPIKEAVSIAKEFIHAAIEDALHIGSGHGPTNHWAYNRRKRC